MEPDETDQDQLVAKLVSEILPVVDRVGELQVWVEERLDGSINDAALQQACIQIAEQYLNSDPPQTGSWEHLLVTLAVHSGKTRRHFGLSACRSVVRHLCDLLGDERLRHFDAPKSITLASALTVVLAIQDRLTQDVEVAVRRLCDGFPDMLPEIADRCQDIWKRHGQMSSRPGLFLWDVRRHEWRLAQDFKPYRSSP